jgi:hypothetical protein
MEKPDFLGWLIADPVPSGVSPLGYNELSAAFAHRSLAGLQCEGGSTMYSSAKKANSTTKIMRSHRAGVICVIRAALPDIAAGLEALGGEISRM